MKFSIKRAGVMFTILAVVVLAVAGVLCGVSFGNGAKVDLNTNGNVEPVAEQTPEFILQGTDKEMATQWNNAVQKSIDEGREVFVQLGKDWVAVESDSDLGTENTSFNWRDFLYFLEGALYVPSSANIKLDLNGFVLDRAHNALVDSFITQARYGGNVITVFGAFTLKDSAFESMRDQIYADYYNNAIKDVKYFLNLPIGRIQGGNNESFGGGIYATGSNASLVIESGMICLNKTNREGGGLYVDRVKQFIIKDGIIAGNFSQGHGGGICGNGDFDFQGGIIYGNGIISESKSFILNGCGMYFTNIKSSNISDMIIAKNKSSAVLQTTGGGGIYAHGANNSTMTIKNTRIENNIINGEGGGIKINVADVTLTNVNIINNTAGTFGGGILLDSSSYNQNIKMSNTTVMGNIAGGNGGGLGYIYPPTQKSFYNFGENTQIYDNHLTNSKENNFPITQKKFKFNIIENLGNSRIGIGGNAEVFSSGYSTYNAGVAPSNYFFNDNEGDVVCLNSAGEVQFAKSIKSNVYDYVYIDNNVRKSYKANSIMHGNNDFDIIQTSNSGNLVLGKIAPCTSVNEFIGNISYSGARIKLIDNKGNIIYGQGADSKYQSLLSNKLELAVGTGWKLQVLATDNSLIEEMYLSVLGDLTGDGKANSLDVTYMKKLLNDKNLYARLSNKPYLQLATLIVNTGKLSKADREILWNVACGRMDIRDFL